MTEAAEKIHVLEAEIDKLEKKLKTACELNIELYGMYRAASKQLRALEIALENVNE